MMKKLLSIILSVCMLMSMVIIPVAVQAATEEVSAYEESTLGSYYKFTFENSEEGYDYTTAYASDTAPSGKAIKEYKGNTFYPLWTHRESKNTIVDAEYKTITTSDEKEYNVLEIVSSYGGVQFTPVNKDGQPYELTPGKTYKIKINMFIPAACTNSQNYVVLGNNDRFYNTDNKVNINGKVNTVQQAYRNQDGDLGIVKGSSFAYAYTAGTYDETTTLGKCACGSASCSHQQRATDSFKVYGELEREYTVPEIYDLDEETNSYSAEVDILTSSSDSTVVGTATLNNYLTLYLSGGQANKVGSEGYYGTAPTAAGASWNSAERINATYQIISIEVYEVGVGSANLHVNGETTTVKGDANTAIDTSIVTVPEGCTISGWYTDEALQNEATSADLTFTEGVAPIDLYAKVIEKVDYADTTLGSYYKFTFENSEEGYDYTTAYASDTAPSGKAIKEYKGNTFYPLWTHRESKNTIVDAEYKTITTSDEKEYNVLEIVSSYGGAQFTPVTKDGQPYELTPGKTYKIKINMFIPAASSGSQTYVVLGNNDRFYNTSNRVDINGKKNYVQQAYRSSDLGIVKGDSFAYAYTAGTYDETTKLDYCVCGSASCSHQQRATDAFKVYREIDMEYTVPGTDTYTLNEETNSYSAEVDILTSNTDSTVVGTVNLNNYLTLYLSGGQANKVGSLGYYGTAPTAADASWNSSERINATYQIISIEVYEAGYAAANLHVNGETTTLKGTAGDEIDTSSVVVPEGCEIEGWYTDAAFENAATSPLSFTEGVVDLYAKVVEKIDYADTTLGKYHKFTFDEGNQYEYKVSYPRVTTDDDYPETWKGTTFYPLYSAGFGSAPTDAEYKSITDSDGVEYDVLELRTRATQGTQFTPLTADGQPYELTPGKTYKVKVEMFNPRGTGAAKSSIVLGSSDMLSNSYSITNINTGKTQTVPQAYSTGTLGVGDGDTFYYNFTDGSYNKTTTLGDCKCSSPDECTSTASTHKKPYTIYQADVVEFTLPEINYTMDDEFGYSASVTCTDGTTTANFNNYLTLLFVGSSNVNGGADGTAYYCSEDADTESTIPATYQIVSIEVYEVGVVPYAAGEASDDPVETDVIDGHTYKVDFSYTAQKLGSDVEYNFGTANAENAFDNRSAADPFVISSANTEIGKTYNATRYITVDLAGGIAADRELGYDYDVDSADYDALFLYFAESDADNILYFEDFVVTDLNAVVATGSASILTDEAAVNAGNKQAIRYYFNYETVDGTKLKMDGNEFTVKARGFIFKNGAVSDKYAAGMTLADVDGKKIKMSVKEDGFNSCWKHENGRMTYSIYFTGFNVEDERELVVRGFITLIDPETNEEFTIYSDTINRSVVGVKNHNDIGFDTDIDAGQ